MAAFALSAVQCDGTVGLLDKIRVVQADTVSLIQGGSTAGSTTSESSCEAVRLSCNILVERLKPLKKKLQEEMGSVKWDMLILQIEGSFIQGLGFFMLEEYETNLDGLVLADGTWNYKIPTIDTGPQQFNVEILNSEHHQHRVLSSKASGEPPVLLAASVHCATRSAVNEARKQLLSWSSLDGPDSAFQLEVPATMPVVKELCGLDIVERYLKWKMGNK